MQGENTLQKANNVDGAFLNCMQSQQRAQELHQFNQVEVASYIVNLTIGYILLVFQWDQVRCSSTMKSNLL